MKSETIYRLLWQPLGSIKLHKHIISKKKQRKKAKEKNTNSIKYRMQKIDNF